MRGSDDVIELLNDVLSAELTAINQYFLDAKQFRIGATPVSVLSFDLSRSVR